MSNKNGVVNPSLISFVSIRTLSGNIDIGDIDVKVIPKPKSYNFAFSLNFGIQKDKKLVRIILGVTIISIDEIKKSKTEVGSYKTEFIFKVDNLLELIKSNDKNKTADIDPALALTLVSIAYSTMRGIVNTRTQGTILNGVILPVIDPGNLINTSTVRESTNKKISDRL